MAVGAKALAEKFFCFAKNTFRRDKYRQKASAKPHLFARILKNRHSRKSGNPSPLCGDGGETAAKGMAKKRADGFARSGAAKMHFPICFYKPQKRSGFADSFLPVVTPRKSIFAKQKNFSRAVCLAAMAKWNHSFPFRTGP